MKILISHVFFVIGIIMIITTITIIYNSKNILATYTETEGIVIRYREWISITKYRDVERKTNMYCPIVEYKIPSNSKSFLLEENVSSDSPDYEIGEKLIVLYDDKDPSKAIIKSFSELYLEAIITGVLGLAFASVGYYNVQKNKNETS